VPAVPPGGVLVHIGPPKTGTTSLQVALARERPRLPEHGVLYPGLRQRHRREGEALLQRNRTDGKKSPASAWDDLVREVRAAPLARVCISSENLARARPEHVRRIVSDLGSDRVHMVVVARRLDRLLPSAWQQRVKGVAETLTYGDWLTEVLEERPNSAAARTFWRHHRLSETLREWLEQLPPERIMVVVGDESDRTGLLRVFEQLLGLPAGILVGDGSGSSNTSLTHERAELLRRLTVALGDRGTSEQRAEAGRTVLRVLLEVPRTEHEHSLPGLPPWAVTKVAEASLAQVEAIHSSGVRVAGDPAVLLVSSGGPASALGPDPDVVPLDVAARALSALWRPRAPGQGTAVEDPGDAS
jgi:hypothetical protein